MPTVAHHFLVAAPIFLVAVAVTLALVPLVRWLSFRVGAVAQPGGRNIHEKPTGRLGGLALMGGFVVAVAVFGRAVPYWGQIEAIAVTVAALKRTVRPAVATVRSTASIPGPRRSISSR